MKVVINKCWGGFSISKACAEHMAKNGHQKAQQELNEWCKKNAWVKAFVREGKWPEDCSSKESEWLEIDAKYHKEARWYGYFIEQRGDSLLVKAVEELGEAASGEMAALKIVEIPDGTDYEIHDYDGRESVHEKHSVWY